MKSVNPWIAPYKPWMGLVNPWIVLYKDGSLVQQLIVQQLILRLAVQSLDYNPRKCAKHRLITSPWVAQMSSSWIAFKEVCK